jgi:hypothetical protein
MGGGMEKTLASLEIKREQLYRQLMEIGDFRRGTISVTYRKCGKKNCACAKEGHPGHGPLYLWNATIGGKSFAKNLKLGAEMDKYLEETSNYKKSLSIFDALIEVNEQISSLRPVRVIEDENELAALKKKLQQMFMAKLKKK